MPVSGFPSHSACLSSLAQYRSLSDLRGLDSTVNRNLLGKAESGLSALVGAKPSVRFGMCGLPDAVWPGESQKTFYKYDETLGGVPGFLNSPLVHAAASRCC